MRSKKQIDYSKITDILFVGRTPYDKDYKDLNDLGTIRKIIS